MRFKNHQKLNTEDPSVSLTVREGSFQVFLDLRSDRRFRRRLPLCRVKAGDTVPGLRAIRTVDGEEVCLSLMLSAVGESELETVPAEAEHGAAFRDLCSLPQGGEDPEALASALLALAGQRFREENERVERTFSSSARTREQNVHGIRGVFSLKHESLPGSADGETPLYRALAFLCAKMKMKIAPYSRAAEAFGDSFTLQDLSRISGFLCREVELPKNFYRSELDPFLVLYGDSLQHPAVCFRRLTGYMCYLPESGEIIRLSDADKLFDNCRIYMISRSLPNRVIKLPDMLKFTFRNMRKKDLAAMILGTLLATLVSVHVSSLYELLFDSVVESGDKSFLWIVFLFLLAFLAGGFLYTLSKAIASFRSGSRIKYALQGAMYDRLLHMPESYFRSGETAAISYRVENLPNVYIMIFTAVGETLLTLLFGVIYILKMNSYSPLLSAIAWQFILIQIAASVVIGWISQKYQRTKAGLTGEIRSFLFQSFSQIKTVRCCGAEEQFLNRYQEHFIRYATADKKGGIGIRLTTAIITAASCFAVVFFYEMLGDHTVNLALGRFLAFMSAFSAFSASMVTVSKNIVLFLITWPMLKNSADILKIVPEDPSAGIIPKELKGALSVRNLSFRYPKKAEPTLRNISFDIAPGESVAFVGASGSGKTTLLRLLLGLETVYDGRICYDGIDLKELNRTELRRKIGTVMQDGVLFPGTVRGNICLACPSAGDADVRAAAETADIWEDISRMPMGLDTRLSEQAQTISGGQRQRIMIARAIVSSPRVVFFDEATSSLDNISQAKISENLSRLRATRVFVAQRLSTVKNCDRIYVIDQGRIAECGDYDSLIALRGVFYHLVQSQMTE